MNKTLILTSKELKNLKKQLITSMIKSDNEYIEFIAQVLDCRITAYKSGKVLFQGKDAETMYLTFKQQFTNEPYDSAGSDEVGTGDYFGPVVVCACYLPKEKYELMDALGVNDSKALTDEKILKIAPTLFKELPNSILILDNKKYNEVQPDNNMNKIKARLHNQAFLHLQKKVKHLPELTIIDQFTPKKNYFEYLKDEEKIFNDLLFTTKAESKYLVVAAASIIARYTFLNELSKMINTYNFPFPKGAGKPVDVAIKQFRELYPDKLHLVAKLNFKNTNK